MPNVLTDLYELATYEDILQHVKKNKQGKRFKSKNFDFIEDQNRIYKGRPKPDYKPEQKQKGKTKSTNRRSRPPPLDGDGRWSADPL